MADYSRSHRRGSINQAASPMTCVDETLDERPDVVENRKKKMVEAQNFRSPFLIGSIDEVSRRISKLDEKLQHYTQLVVESRASGSSSSMTDIVAHSDMVRDIHKLKEKETQEINKFAGVYSFKSTFFNKPNERMRNIQKITMTPSKAAVKKDTGAGKPRFVELHQYPGYHPRELTTLPHDSQAVNVLKKVAAAQPMADRMSTYKPVFEKLFLSEMSKAILQDMFWWIFLEKWQTNKQIQALLFNRVAHNYVKLLMYAKHPRYRYTFLRDFPNLMAQSVYAAFCEAFPDSYRQFNEEFKNDIMALVFEWVTGIPAAPRQWQQWNMDKLEPTGIKLREDMLKQSKSHKKSHTSSSVLSFLDVLEANIAEQQQMGSESTVPTGSVSSLSSIGGSKRVRLAAKIRRISHAQMQEPVSEPAQHQHRPVTRATVKPLDSSQHRSKLEVKSRAKQAEDALTPIHEFDEEGRLTKGSTSGSPDAKVSTKSSMRPYKPAKLQSHPIGKGAEITRVTFNRNGNSPLVAHYMRKNHLEYDIGPLTQMQFSKITNLPPLDSVTYKDLLQQSYKNIHQLDKKIKKVHEHEVVEQARFMRRQRHLQEQLKTKQAMLLSKPAEVKKLADLIILGQKTDKDSFTGCAEAAIAAALMNQEITPR